MAAFYLPDTAALREAEELIDRMGEGAYVEARAIADRGRNIGNHISFCRWRQIGRLIDFLSRTEAEGTVH